MSGAGVREFAVLGDYLAVHQGGDITIRVLHEALPSGRQVFEHGRVQELEIVEVDDVDVGAASGFEQTSVRQSDEPRGVMRLHLNHPFKRNPAVLAVPRPMRHEERREARIADRADVRAAVALVITRT